MRLIERFLAKWKKSDLSQALTCIENEIESRYGVISDENKIEKVFFQPDKHGNMTGNVIFRECIELFSFLKKLNVSRIPLMGFLEELSGWNHSYEAERLEKSADKKELQKLEYLIEKINEISCKKKLILLKEKEMGYTLECSCALEDYQNGRVTFSDMQVRSLLLKAMSEPVRILVIADSEKGDCCIEI